MKLGRCFTEYSSSIGRAVLADWSPGRTTAAAWALGLALHPRARAEDRVAYRYEDYGEENDRIQVRTHGFWFEKELVAWSSLKGSFVYDSISGATPLGPTIPGVYDVPKAEVDETRYAGFLESTFGWEQFTLTPQVAYSDESDYRSLGVSLAGTVDFNEKNTTLSLGISRNWDELLPNPGTANRSTQDKYTIDGFIGLTQVLGPTTVLTVNATIGNANGYLDDPYKRVLFLDFPHFPGQPYTVWAESRPDVKLREVGLVSVRQYVSPLRGAAEVDYRFSHDSFGINASTVTAQWHQEVASWMTISGLFRFHTQTAADFYGPNFPGDPSLPPGFDPSIPPIPEYYSSDYRVSALNTYTYGVLASVRPVDWGSIELGYKRYHMEGTDGVTSPDQYPTANVYSAGFTIWF